MLWQELTAERAIGFELGATQSGQNGNFLVYNNSQNRVRTFGPVKRVLKFYEIIII